MVKFSESKAIICHFYWTLFLPKKCSAHIILAYIKGNTHLTLESI